MQQADGIMIMDACVLIDFVKADKSILQLITSYIGCVYIPSPIVDEVNEVSEKDLEDLGLIILEPNIEDAYNAVSQVGPTSFQDKLCLLSAKRYGYICVTNDKNLRKLCVQEGVGIMWGLALLVELHKKGGIPTEDVLTIANNIHEINPKHITDKIITNFTKIIKKQSL